MPNTIISLENVNGRWVGEIEIGAPIARRQVIRSDSFSDGIAQIVSAYEGYLSTFGDRPIFSGSGAVASSDVSSPPHETESAQLDPEAFVSEVAEAVGALGVTVISPVVTKTTPPPSGPDDPIMAPAYSLADLPPHLDPVNESPKLPRGRHKNGCDCPRCEAKRAERAALEAVA